MTKPKHTELKNYADLIVELAQNLEKQAVLVRETSRALRENRSHFVACRGEELEVAPRALETLAQQLVEAESVRLHIHERIASHLNASPTTLRFAQIAATVHGPVRARLDRARTEARSAAEELNIESSIGERLLDWSARCHETTLIRLAGLQETDASYGPDGRERQQSGGNAILIDATR